MAKKAPQAQLLTLRIAFLHGLTLVILVSVGLCVCVLYRLHYTQETLGGSSMVPPRSSTSRPLVQDFEGPPKIAFLFLVRRNLPLDFLWGSFFENTDSANFSIYIHSEPGFVFDESTCRSSFFYGRQLSNSIKVKWGESSMIQAERLLLEAALEDPANQRFVLLSDSCVPLYNFSYIYNYVMASPRSFVDSFLDAKEKRYNPKMSPVIPKEKWRKGSQWITLVRKHAEVIVDDEVVFPVFKEVCKVCMRNLNSPLKLKRHDCISDEHYVQTLLAMSNVEGELERRTLTYTEWNQSATKMERRSWHPVTFTYASAGPQRIKGIKGISHVYYETEFRTEWCRVNSTSAPCFLFARKFSEGAAMRLLSDGIFGSFDARSLIEMTA
ncbi:Glycosyl transferase, family 14 [Dillenia turbinata]|uniref:Glycosyl transferase, family 14 n=1 Tax=Dillenia turbinata TaxID=194707 RepID=A0AAN8VEH8_9MAGN